jgi:hypothetical protein
MMITEKQKKFEFQKGENFYTISSFEGGITIEFIDKDNIKWKAIKEISDNDFMDLILNVLENFSNESKDLSFDFKVEDEKITIKFTQRPFLKFDFVFNKEILSEKEIQTLELHRTSRKVEKLEKELQDLKNTIKERPIKPSIFCTTPGNSDKNNNVIWKLKEKDEGYTLSDDNTRIIFSLTGDFIVSINLLNLAGLPLYFHLLLNNTTLFSVNGCGSSQNDNGYNTTSLTKIIRVNENNSELKVVLNNNQMNIY